MKVLPLIVAAQFCCTSVWFAGNAVVTELATVYQLPAGSIGYLTSAIQLGFIAGTLVFALLSVADRFSPSRIFLFAAVAAAGFNLCALWPENTLITLLLGRIFTGFALAGIYPVGMKIAADHFDRGLGRSLGFLVGALVLGTAFPHLLKALGGNLPWRSILLITSAIALAGGLIIGVLVPDGPYRKASQRPDFRDCLIVFRRPALRQAAFGYFGHMWELYAFWAFLPVLLSLYQFHHPAAHYSIPLCAFLIIGSGSLACVLAGFGSEIWGVRNTAKCILLASGCCCLLAPLLLVFTSSPLLWLGFLHFWGMVVVADSPLFSTLVAQNAAPATKGTALTMTNCIGFSITIVSMLLIGLLFQWSGSAWVFSLLAVGPLLGWRAVGD